MEFNPKGNFVATGGGDKLVKIWDTNNNCESRQIKPSNCAV